MFFQRRHLLGILFGVALATSGGWGWQYYQNQRIEAHEAATQTLFAPALARLEAGGGDVDIDVTIHVLDTLENALPQQTTLNAYLDEIAQTDWQGLPKELIAAQRQLLNAQQALYRQQLSSVQQESFWIFSRDLLLQHLIPGYTSQAAAYRSKIQGNDALENALIQAIEAYKKARAACVQQYTRLNASREEAWNAALRGDWGKVERAASMAVLYAPQDREGHLLLAWARLEAGGPEGQARVDSLLERYLEAHPNEAAPALILRGTRKERAGDKVGAVNDYEQAAKIPPPAVSPIHHQSYVGTGLAASYAAMILEAGWFSPALHLAHLHGETALPPLMARVAQKQWDYLWADVQGAGQLWGETFFLSADDLSVSLAAEGGVLKIRLENHASQVWTQAQLLLYVRTQEMLTGDYRAFEVVDAPKTLDAQATVDCGAITVTAADKIAEVQAVFVSTEGVHRWAVPFRP